jgi:hypothetical protein
MIRAMVLPGGTNGGELSKTSSHNSGKARRALQLVADQQGSTQPYLGFKQIAAMENLSREELLMSSAHLHHRI